MIILSNVATSCLNGVKTNYYPYKMMPSQVNYVVTGGPILEPGEKKLWIAQYYNNRQNYEVIL